jgi:hypothetical protein
LGEKLQVVKHIKCSGKDRDMSKLVITLDDEDMLDLQEILLDEDEKAALEFLKTRIAAKLPTKGSGHCDSSRNNPYLVKPD